VTVNEVEIYNGKKWRLQTVTRIKMISSVSCRVASQCGRMGKANLKLLC